jgi:hypothetical protein
MPVRISPSLSKTTGPSPGLGTRRSAAAAAGPMVAFVCAENNTGFFNPDVDPMAVAVKSDF